MASRAVDKALVDEVQAACRRATDWVLSHQGPSGVIGDPQYGFKYYRGPWALSLMGEVDAALSLCEWIRGNLLNDGHLDGEARVLRDGWAYRDSVLIVGAHMLAQYDLSHGLVDSLMEWQDPVSGGFANDMLDDGQASDEMDIPYAAGPGFALLATGHVSEARRVADFLSSVYSAQEAMPERMYCFWSRENQRLITESDPSFAQRFVVDRNADRMQRWTIGGISAGFLGRMYLADPLPRYLELAEMYQAFSMTSTEAQFKYPSVCKSSWGAALLYQITGKETYLSWLERMASWYLDTQEPEGWWHPWVEQSSADVIEITLEFIQHLQVLLGAVAPTFRTR